MRNFSGELITDPAALEDLLAHLRKDGRFAYDSEFIGELTYHPQAVPHPGRHGRAHRADRPAGRHRPEPFWELLGDPDRWRKSFTPASRTSSRSSATWTGGRRNVFDTQIAAGFVGLPYPVSLSKLVLEMTGVKLGKGLTFTHWDQRPLSADAASLRRRRRPLSAGGAR